MSTLEFMNKYYLYFNYH